jgi:antitoxin CptB
LLENDLIIERFFQTYGDQLEEADIQALEVILSLSDNDLLDLLLARTALPADLTSPATSKILSWLRSV